MCSELQVVTCGWSEYGVWGVRWRGWRGQWLELGGPAGRSKKSRRGFSWEHNSISETC